MKIEITDYNKADVLASTSSHAEWSEIADTLKETPPYFKASDQAGIQGSWIFDPVGTNGHIKQALVSEGWRTNIPIPAAFNFLGKTWTQVSEA